MTATPSIDLPGWMAEQLSQASPDLLGATCPSLDDHAVSRRLRFYPAGRTARRCVADERHHLSGPSVPERAQDALRGPE